MKKKLLVVALGLSSSMVLFGCGSDDSTGSNPAASPVFYTVKVIDGYLKNAQVWLDVNGNKQLDLDEPSVLSAAGGVAILDVTGIDNPSQYSTYAKIIVGQTIDEDSGPVTNDYVMSALPGELALTPLSTLVSIEVAQNSVGTETAEQLAAIKQAAIAKVANDFGIEEANVLSDYIASGSGSTSYVAANIVSSKILPDDESELIVVSGDDPDTSAFNKQTAAVSGMIKDVVAATAEEDFDTQAAVFDSGDDLDTDSDADGVPNAFDALPDNADEWLDTDGDTIGNNADTDDDGDGVEDNMDADPLDPLVGEFDECVVSYTADASIADFNTQIAACQRLPEMDLSDNSILRIIAGSGQTRAYVFNSDGSADFYQNGIQYNRTWEIDTDGNLALYYGSGPTLEYLMRLIDDTDGNLAFGIYANGSQSMYDWDFTDFDASVAILACEEQDSDWDDVNNLPLNYRTYEDFKLAIGSCQSGKLFTDFSTGFIDDGMTLTTGDGLSPADDVDTYQFNADGTGTFTYSEGAGDISVDTTWTIFEEGIIKVVLNYTDENDVAQTAHDYLAIVETNGIGYSVKVFSRSTEFEGLGEAADGDLWSTVMSVPDTD